MLVEYPDRELPEEIHVSGNGTEYFLTDLQPSTEYRVRLAGINGLGKGRYSDTVIAATVRPEGEKRAVQCQESRGL